MATESDTAVRAADVETPTHAIDTPEFLVRLAEDMRVKSGSDLPLSCFVEQVKMQLAGRSPVELPRTAPDRVAKLSQGGNYQSSECYLSWAMPE